MTYCVNITSREHEQEQSLAEQQSEEFLGNTQLAWNNTDETVFTTPKTEEQKRRKEEDKEHDKFTLPTADRLVAMVAATALTG